jgi:hypothetical protein
MTGSSSDDWIYFHFHYNLLVTFKYSAIADLLKHWSSPGTTSKTQERSQSHWNTHSKHHTWMKSSNHTSRLHSSTNFPWLSSTENSELNCSAVYFWDNSFSRTPPKTPSPIVVDPCLPLRCLATDFLYLCPVARRGPHREHSFPSIVEACPFLHSCFLAASYNIRPIVAYSVSGCLSSRCLAML